MLSSTVYKGSDPSAIYLSEGLVKYSLSTIVERALADIRDAMKPGNRALLTDAHSFTKTGNRYVKSAELVGSVIGKLHPHGDGAVYKTLTRMVFESRNMLYPIFVGRGSFGSPALKTNAAAMRYTEVSSGDFMKNFYGFGYDYVPLRRSGTEKYLVPAYLMPKFPAILALSSKGVASGFASSIPGYRVTDIIALCRSYMNKGYLDSTDIMFPDVPTGGVLLASKADALRLMVTPIGSMEVRAKVVIEGRVIKVLEIPSDTSVPAIIQAIENVKDTGSSTFSTIVSAENVVGSDSDCMIKIKCRNKDSVQKNLMDLYRLKILSGSIRQNSVVLTPTGEFVVDESGTPIEGETVVPRAMSVHDIIKWWVDWRTDVIRKVTAPKISKLESRIQFILDFLEFTADDSYRMAYLEAVGSKDMERARSLVVEFFASQRPDRPVSEDSIQWISSRAVSLFADPSKYVTENQKILAELEYLRQVEVNPYLKMNEEFDEVLDSVGKDKRSMELTNTVYKFSKVVEVEDEDTSMVFFTFTKDGFIRKTRSVSEEDDSNVLRVIQAPANATLIGFDNSRNVLRVYGADIPMTRPGQVGVSLLKYFGFTEYESFDLIQKVWCLLYMCHLDGKTRTLLFRDGKFSYLNTALWADGKRKNKVVRKHMHASVLNLLLDVLEPEDTESGAGIVVMDTSRGADSPRFGFTAFKDVPKSKSGNVKAFSGSGDVDITSYAIVNTAGVLSSSWFVPQGESGSVEDSVELHRKIKFVDVACISEDLEFRSGVYNSDLSVDLLNKTFTD